MHSVYAYIRSFCLDILFDYEWHVYNGSIKLFDWASVIFHSSKTAIV